MKITIPHDEFTYLSVDWTLIWYLPAKNKSSTWVCLLPLAVYLGFGSLWR